MNIVKELLQDVLVKEDEWSSGTLSPDDITEHCMDRAGYQESCAPFTSAEENDRVISIISIAIGNLSKLSINPSGNHYRLA